MPNKFNLKKENNNGVLTTQSRVEATLHLRLHHSKTAFFVFPLGYFSFSQKSFNLLHFFSHQFCRMVPILFRLCLHITNYDTTVASTTIVSTVYLCDYRTIFSQLVSSAFVPSLLPAHLLYIQHASFNSTTTLSSTVTSLSCWWKSTELPKMHN